METHSTQPTTFPEALKPFLGKVVEIPMSCIHSNPDNPGPVITEEMVADLAANILQVGLNNPIKVMVQGAIPLAEGSSPGVGDFQYINLSGELRYRAFAKLGKATIPAFILNPTPEEAFLISRLDNKVRDRGWWPDYLSVEGLIKINPDLTQRQIATRLELDLEKVSRAIKLLPLLNPVARGLIDRQSINSNKGKRPIGDLAAARLAALGPESVLKPGIKGEASPKLWPYQPVALETQDLVRRALAVALDRELTEAGVMSLVEWIKNGNEPETFEATGKGEKVKKPSTVGSPRSTANQKPEVATSANTPIGAPPRNDSKLSTAGTGLVLPILWGMLKKTAAKDLERVHSGLLRMTERGIFKWAMSLLVVGGGTYVGVNHWKPTAGSPQPAVSSSNPSTVNQKEIKAIEPQMNTDKRDRATTLVSAPHAKASKHSHLSTFTPVTDSAVSPNQEQLIAWAEADSPFVSQFAGRFYGLHYMKTKAALDYFKQNVARGYYPEFISDYFPPEKLKDMESTSTVESFKATHPPNLVKLEGVMDEFLVEGILTTQTNSNDLGQLTSHKPVAFKIDLRHIEGVKELVYRVSTVEPASLTGSEPSKDSADQSPQGATVPKKDDGAAKFVGEAVGAAAKKFSGF